MENTAWCNCSECFYFCFESWHGPRVFILFASKGDFLSWFYAMCEAKALCLLFYRKFLWILIKTFQWRLLFWVLNMWRRNVSNVRWYISCLDKQRWQSMLVAKIKLSKCLVMILEWIFLILVRSRIWIDFRFYKAMKDLEPFKEVCSYNSVLCVVGDDSLHISWRMLDLLTNNDDFCPPPFSILWQIDLVGMYGCFLF